MDAELFNAAIRGDGSFFEQNVSLNLNRQVTAQGNSVLHVAAKRGAVGRNHELLRMGNLEKDTALHDAVRNGHFDIVELLIREHPRLTSLTNNAGESPLFLAVDRAFYKIALHILEEAVNVPRCSYGGRNKMNLLHVAVIGTGQGKMEVVCPFYTKECFVLGLSFCLSRDIKSIYGASGVFLLWGWGNAFLFARSLLLIRCRLIWTKSLIPGYYERNQYCPTRRKTAETENVGRSTVRAMEEGRADVVHMNVTSVTTPEVTTSLMLPLATQLDWASMPAIIEDLVLPKSTPISNKSNSINTPSISVEVLLARIVTPNLESTSQLARTIGVNPINALKNITREINFKWRN
uniref:Uncharacterized protein n=1 Tax=Quercus lobata TaxID=97700 RepID=A0A7N2MLP4_QUELO